MLSNLLEKVTNAEKSALLGSFNFVLVLLPSEQLSLLPLQLSRQNIDYLNVSFELSKALVGLSVKQREAYVTATFKELINVTERAFWLGKLDVLFEPSLKIDALQLLKRISKQNTVIAVWPGDYDDKALTYSLPGKPDYKYYPLSELKDVQVVYACDRSL
jgi:hypothetical protein